MDADIVGATGLYYTPHEGDDLPIWDGCQLVRRSFNEIPLDLSAMQPWQVRDVLASSASQLALSEPWESVAGVAGAPGSRGAAIDLVRERGVWLDPQGRTYLGTVLADGVGRTSMIVHPRKLPGGTRNVLGVWNAYHRQRVKPCNQDGTAEPWIVPWNPQNPWRVLNNSWGNQILWVDGLGQSPVHAEFQVTVVGQSGPQDGGTTGIAFDTLQPHPLYGDYFGVTNQFGGNGSNQGTTMVCQRGSHGQLGLRWAAPVEHGNSFGEQMKIHANTYSALFLELDT